MNEKEEGLDQKTEQVALPRHKERDSVQDSASELCKSQSQQPSVRRLLQTGSLRFLREEESRIGQA